MKLYDCISGTKTHSKLPSHFLLMMVVLLVLTTPIMLLVFLTSKSKMPLIPISLSLKLPSPNNDALSNVLATDTPVNHWDCIMHKTMDIEIDEVLKLSTHSSRLTTFFNCDMCQGPAIALSNAVLFYMCKTPMKPNIMFSIDFCVAKLFNCILKCSVSNIPSLENTMTSLQPTPNGTLMMKLLNHFILYQRAQMPLPFLHKSQGLWSLSCQLIMLIAHKYNLSSGHTNGAHCYNSHWSGNASILVTICLQIHCLMFL